MVKTLKNGRNCLVEELTPMPGIHWKIIPVHCVEVKDRNLTRIIV
jgi:hypothetical protein